MALFLPFRSGLIFETPFIFPLPNLDFGDWNFTWSRFSCIQYQFLYFWSLCFDNYELCLTYFHNSFWTTSLFTEISECRLQISSSTSGTCVVSVLAYDYSCPKRECAGPNPVFSGSCRWGFLLYPDSRQSTPHMFRFSIFKSSFSIYTALLIWRVTTGICLTTNLPLFHLRQEWYRYICQHVSPGEFHIHSCAT